MSGRRWTREEEAKLVLRWGGVSVDALARQLDRTPCAVWRRAYLCGLTRAARSNTLNAFARELGASYNLMLAIVRRAGIKPLPNSSRTRRPRGQRYYDDQQVREAFDRWLSSETIWGAARRLGMHDNSLRRRVKRAGVYVPQYAHRYPSEVLERVAAMGRPSVKKRCA